MTSLPVPKLSNFCKMCVDKFIQRQGDNREKVLLFGRNTIRKNKRKGFQIRIHLAILAKPLKL